MPPPSWGILQGRWPLHPPFGRSAPNPGLLSCEKKVGKDSPKPAVLDSLVREDRPYRAALRLHTGSSQPLIQTDLPLWAGGVNWSCFLPAPYRGYTFSCQSVARQVYCSRGYLRVLLTATNTTRAEAGGIQGGVSPLCRRSRNQEVPGESLVTFFSQESHPGFGAERPKGGCRDYRPAKAPGAWGGVPSPQREKAYRPR